MKRNSIVFIHFIFACFIVILSLSIEDDSVFLIDQARKLSRGSSDTIDIQKAEKLYWEVIRRNDSFVIEGLTELAELLERTDSGPPESRYAALELLQKASELGNSDAQYKLGVAYGTGIHIGLVPMDPGRSLFLQYIAALSGSPEANMAIGYRFASGIGVPESCEIAKKHYEYVANVAVKQIESRGYSYFIDRAKVVDDINTRGFGKKGREVDEEIVDYYRHLAHEGEASAAFSLGMMYITGTKILDQDYNEAMKYMVIASKGNLIPATGLLGYLYVQGFGSQDTRRYIEGVGLKTLLSSAMKERDVNAIVAYGYSYLHGIHVKRNVTKAVELFHSVSAKHQDAGFYLGEIFMGRGAPEIEIDINSAVQAYLSSSQKGNVLALHRLGHMHSIGIGVAKHCPSALNSFKIVAEKGDWMKGLTEANRLYSQGDVSSALLLFSRFAALGIDSAQFNTADIVSRKFCPSWQTQVNASVNLQLSPRIVVRRPIADETELADSDTTLALSVGVELDAHMWNVLVTDRNGNSSSETNSVSLNESLQVACEVRALQFYGLSASQNDAESMLRIGDIHYYGLAGLSVDKAEAARYYEIAADLRHPHANFNLGIMHEIGDGIEQDFHLAKRFYDQAADFDPEARLPRSIAVFLLSSHRDIQTWIGQAETNKLVERVIPVLETVKQTSTTVFDYLSSLAAYQWISRRFSTSLDIRAAQFKKSRLSSKRNTHIQLLPLALSALKASLSILDTVLVWMNGLLVSALDSFLRVCSMIVGQRLPTGEEIAAVWRLNGDVITELENYLLVVLMVMFVCLLEVFRARRRRVRAARRHR